MRAVLVPADPDLSVQAVNQEDTLVALQARVGGFIEAVPWRGEDEVTCYLNEEGKLTGLSPNRRATWMLQRIGSLLPGDWVAGDLLVCGFHPATGEHRDLPVAVAEIIIKAVNRSAS